MHGRNRDFDREFTTLIREPWENRFQDGGRPISWSDDWANHIMSNLYKLSDPSIDYMLSGESMRDFSWSKKVLERARSEAVDRILLSR